MRRDWRGCLLVLALSAGGACGAIGAANAAGAPAAAAPLFAYEYPIVAKAGAQAYLLELPQDAYSWLSRDAGLADVVVVDAGGRQVASGPYRAGAPTSHPVTLDAPLRPVPQSADGMSGPRIQRNANGDIIIESGASTGGASMGGTSIAQGASREFLFDAKTALAPERLEFPPIDHDVSLTIAVDSSDNLQDWVPLVRSASIVTLGKGDGAVDSRVLKLAGSAARYYRVRVLQGDAPWLSDGASSVTLSGTVEDASARDEAPQRWLTLGATSTSSSGQGVDYDYQLPEALPVNALRVTLGTSDSVARLDASAVEGSMSSESLGTLVVTPGDQQNGRRPLDVAPRRRELLRLHSVTPLREAPRLAVGWRPDRFVFLPEGKGPYRLLVGSAQARRPAWPVDDALAALRAGSGGAWRPNATTIGPGQELAGRKALEAAHRAFDWTRPLLWIVLLLGAALIIGMAASLLRKPPVEPSDDH